MIYTMPNPLFPDFSKGPYRTRLLKVAEVLEHFGEPTSEKLLKKVKSFEISVWLGVESKEEQREKCGYSACAIGTILHHSWFTRKGFKLKQIMSTFVPSYKEYFSWDAVERFFNLNRDEAFYLFNADSYEDLSKVTPSMVAERIREFVDTDREIFNN